jgi:hypothetical protein
MDREFTNGGQHYRFPFIPTHEIWLDQEFAKGETKFFVDHLIIEWNLMKDGKTYSYAIGKADEAEQKERKKYSHVLAKAKQTLKTHPEMTVPKEIYVKKLFSNEGVDVWIVNGELVRDMYYIEYTEGGHHFVYSFVPHDEVWIDNDLNPAEIDVVLLHELRERYLMAHGWTYTHAHHSSSIIEYKCRRDPSQLKARLQEELDKNNTIKRRA